ncbi:putative glycosylphosphatidylinositol-specific phospholipase C, partial [Operophtera brumata]
MTYGISRASEVAPDAEPIVQRLYPLFRGSYTGLPAFLRVHCTRSPEAHQVIVVYRDQSVFATGEFWEPQMLPSPWPQQDRITGLISYLKHIRRHPGTGFVHQAVLTPTPAFIVLRWISNLREKCAVPVKDQVLPALTEFSPGAPIPGNSAAGIWSPVNVVIADFVEMDDAVFPKTIIQLNTKLLKNTDI